MKANTLRQPIQAHNFKKMSNKSNTKNYGKSNEQQQQKNQRRICIGISFLTNPVLKVNAMIFHINIIIDWLIMSGIYVVNLRWQFTMAVEFVIAPSY